MTTSQTQREKVIAQAREIEGDNFHEILASHKFDGHNADDRELVASLHVISLEGGCRQTGDTQAFGAYVLIENFILCEDSQGFCAASEFSAPCWAQHKFEEIDSEFAEFEEGRQ